MRHRNGHFSKIFWQAWLRMLAPTLEKEPPSLKSWIHPWCIIYNACLLTKQPNIYSYMISLFRKLLSGKELGNEATSYQLGSMNQGYDCPQNLWTKLETQNTKWKLELEPEPKPVSTQTIRSYLSQFHWHVLSIYLWEWACAGGVRRKPFLRVTNAMAFGNHNS